MNATANTTAKEYKLSDELLNNWWEQRKESKRERLLLWLDLLVREGVGFDRVACNGEGVWEGSFRADVLFCFHRNETAADEFLNRLRHELLAELKQHGVLTRANGHITLREENGTIVVSRVSF